MSTFQLEIVTPARVLDEGQVSYVRCPGLDGSFGIMAHHTNAIISLGIGEIKVTHQGKDTFFATSGGFADVKENKVQLLVETAEMSEEIEIDRAKFSANRAKDRLSSWVEGVEPVRAEVSLLRALNRVKVAKR